MAHLNYGLIPYKIPTNSSCWYYYKKQNPTYLQYVTDETTLQEEIDSATSLTFTNIISSDITTDTITSTTITGTTVSTTNFVSSGDVIFNGTTDDNRLYWDSSADTLYIDGEFKTSNSSITLNNDSSETTLTSSDGEDKGFFFKWYDGATENIGFMGFDLSDEKFKIYSETTTTDGEITTGTIGNILIDSLESNSINNYDSNDFSINIDANFDLIVNGTTATTLDIYNTNSSVNIISDSSNDNAIYLDASLGGIQMDVLNGVEINGEISTIQPFLEVSRTSSQSISDSTDTAVSWDTENIELGGFSFTATNSVITIPTDGQYLLTYTISWDTNSSNRRRQWIELNGGSNNIYCQAWYAAHSENDIMTTTGILNCSQSDTIISYVYQNSGGNRDIAPDSNTLKCRLQIYKLG
jgi:hypothetical protein